MLPRFWLVTVRLDKSDGFRSEPSLFRDGPETKSVTIMKRERQPIRPVAYAVSDGCDAAAARRVHPMHARDGGGERQPSLLAKQ